MNIREQIRLERTRKFYGIASLLIILVVIYLVWALKAILAPVIIGLLTAYICLPVLKRFKGMGASKSASVFILFLGFVITIILLFQLVSMAIPDEEGRVELKVSLLINMHDKYQSLMGLNTSGTDGNLIYRLTGNELDPIVHDISCTLKLDSKELEMWYQIVKNSRIHPGLAEGYDDVLSELICEEEANEGFIVNMNNGNMIPINASKPPVLASIFQFLSVWFIMPFVFIYVLVDDGKSRKKIIQLIPNAYFEVALTTMHTINKAIGKYLRCLASNMLIVGVLFALMLSIIGFEIAPAILIGLLNGILNAIPIIGPMVGLIAILVYAIIIEQPTTILTFIDRDSIILWAFISYVVIQIIDNVFLKPFLMGNAINLNPLIIIFAAIGGAIIGGFLGILLAIPVVLIIKVGFHTMRKELRRYFFIY